MRTFTTYETCDGVMFDDEHEALLHEITYWNEKVPANAIVCYDGGGRLIEREDIVIKLHDINMFKCNTKEALIFLAREMRAAGYPFPVYITEDEELSTWEHVLSAKDLDDLYLKKFYIWTDWKGEWIPLIEDVYHRIDSAVSSYKGTIPDTIFKMLSNKELIKLAIYNMFSIGEIDATKAEESIE